MHAIKGIAYVRRIRVPFPRMPRWPSGKASASGAGDPGIEARHKGRVTTSSPREGKLCLKRNGTEDALQPWPGDSL